MDLGLNKKRALITGASKGLGYATAREYLMEGCEVAICARGEEALAAAGAALSKIGPKLHIIAADLNSPEGIDHILTMAGAHMGGVDILCMSTGGPPPGTFAAVEPEEFTVAAQNLIESLVRLVRGVLPGMIEQNWGRVMAVTSVAAKQPIGNLILSNTMRAGITGLMKTLSDEYAQKGVTFNCLMPGLTETERLKSLIGAAAKQQNVSYEAALAAFAQPISAGRVGRPEEFAALAAFLGSERASYITGCNIPVDGGMIKGI